MKIAFFSSKTYDRNSFCQANVGHAHDMTFFELPLNQDSAKLAQGFAAVCVFVNDIVNRSVLELLKAGGTELIVLRCAGFNNVDLVAAEQLGITVARVPAYSPHAVAEHALALILTLNRKTHRAYNRVREGNFALDGLLGFDLAGKTIGVVGAGKIGEIFARIMRAMGCQVLISDPDPSPEVQREFKVVSFAEMIPQVDILSLHCPLTPATHHLINGDVLNACKKGLMLINTSRGKMVDTKAAIQALKSGQLGALGLDVYEEEGDLFFSDLSSEVIQDDVFMRLLTFPNVLITGHQGFFTREALKNIADTTLGNVTAYQLGEGDLFQVIAEKVTGH
ncbi:2-hydroxyacid dehydrogenase [Aliidiomarina halalkaliphila]|uniref:2-hydroxyacid dehydrogenase n=1 Tax=Aliidiomarina halalkaliphila TaxID=2593535 RepID=A0A552X1E0_9GAMM|nr:2-hydroxyacid dehydrogenase [Aliidiomarina halalkaliphila]TRW48756.1 2-hydroxyacid dehydrogenase [Aliidiomarina halalkaliphila]